MSPQSDSKAEVSQLVCPGCHKPLKGERQVGIYRCIAKVDGQVCDTMFYIPKKGVQLFPQRYKGSPL